MIVNRLIFVLVLFNALLTLGLVVWLWRSGIARRIVDLQSALLNPHRLLEENIRRVHPGDTRELVENLVGVPSGTYEGSWIYYSDRHSGYLVSFGQDGRVERVRDWMS